MIQEALAHEPPPPLWGLSESEADTRRSQGQGNDVEHRPSRTLGEILRDNLFTFFNLVLFALGLILVLLGRPTEAVITSGVVLTNVIVAAVQELRAKRKLDLIALLARPQVTVIREGQEKRIDPAEIVLGDLLLASPGDQIVVDGEVVGNGRMDVDESLLTGESDLVSKRAGDAVLSGSFCVSGRALYEAQTVGISSYANKLTARARTFTREYTPLQREVDFIIRILLGLVTFFGMLLVINFVLNEVPFLDSVRAASVLFGLAPSSLFLMIVVAYAVGAVRIADKGALVQQANSVESLCHVTVLCMDKTGTLTTNRIRLEEVRLARDHAANPTETEVRSILGAFARSATAGNRTSEAIAASCEGQKRSFVEEVPFTSQRKWSALSFDVDDLRGLYVLGAPEALEPVLTAGVELGCEVAEWSTRGLRVLLFAYRPEMVPLYDDDGRPQLPADLIPLCLLSFSDELRPEASQTIKGFAKAGIEVKIISGDSPDTVAALARQAGLGEDGAPLKVVSGPELAGMDEYEFVTTVSEANIFGRITPRQKESLVRVLRALGHYVAMTGDGVNDVLALKQANLGIAMQSGSQATRSVADIVLLNDTFTVLPEAFQEGQRILTGMQDILRLYMTRILCLATLIASISIVGGSFPFTPKQNAIISIFTLSIPSFALALWAQPGPVPQGSLTRKQVHFVLPAVITLNVAGLLIYIYFLLTTGNFLDAQHGLTYTMIICGLLLIIFVEPPTEAWVGGDVLSGDWRPTLLTIGLFFFFVTVVAFPPLRDFYDLGPLRQSRDYLVIAGVILLWTFSLRSIWRSRLIDRYLNVDLSSSAGLSDELNGAE